MSATVMFALQISLVLACLFYGARKGGIALGLLGGVGLVILAFGFNIPPGKPPVDVIFTILAVVSASATLQASGGLDVMLQIAERILRKHPRYISMLAPVVSAGLTMICGTGHVVYTLLPIVYDVAIKNNIRPERPMAACSVSAQMGIIASPVSVAVGSLVAMLALYPVAGKTITFTDLLSITIPSTVVGVLMIGLFSWRRGKELADDTEFQNFIAIPENKQYVYGDTDSLLGKVLPSSSWTAMWIFLGAIAIVGLLGSFESLRPVIGVKNGKNVYLSMVLCIQMFMMLAGALILVVTGTDAAKVSKNEVFRSGMIAIVAVFGIAWMADTIFDAHLNELKEFLPQLVQEQPWAYALILILISKFVNSQAAALSALVPVALKLNIDPGLIVAFAPACYGYFILPTYPSDLAAINFDRSGTTRIGKFVINHSFILPGAIGVVSSCIVGFLLATIRGYI